MFMETVNKLSLGYGIFYNPRQILVHPCINPRLTLVAATYPPRYNSDRHPALVLQL